MSETESERRRRRWVTLGELIALAALIVSAFGVWISWKSNDKDGPTRVVEQRQPIPLTLRAKRRMMGEGCKSARSRTATRSNRSG
jgi:hypothetical protein